tara:strand:+ start:6181 stop:7257 length:1077 start_codon:yes stop_codon:yes gene_type:complete
MSDLLSEEQKAKILNLWNSNPDNPPALLDLIREAFPNQEIDGRSKEGRAVKEFLASKEIRARGAHEYQPKDVTLTDEQKEYITNNVYTMKAVEIARILFGNDKINNLNAETRVVNDFIKELSPRDLYADPNDVPQSEYKPPRTHPAAIIKVNKYVLDAIDKSKILPKQKKDIESLIGYLSTYRFIHQINTYSTQADRELFESSFIRYTYDKHDLTQEEVDQYIVLSMEVVISFNIQETIQIIQRQIDQEVETGGKIPMALIEANNTARTEYNQCVTRQQKLLSDLKEKRSSRLSKQIKATASILNLVEMWKDEESRQKMLKLAELRKQSVKEEVGRLETIDEMKAKILGIDENEVLNG